MPVEPWEEAAALEEKGQEIIPGVKPAKEARVKSKTERRKDDCYFTPSWCAQVGVSITRRLLSSYHSPAETPLVLEPAAGEGALYQAAMDAGCNWKWVMRDINQHNCDLQEYITVKDFLEGPPEYGFDAIFTNPPFFLALEFIERSILTTDVVVMLLRLSFLGSMKRHGFFKRHKPDVHVLSKRPSFTGGGTDSADYGWFAWHPEATGTIYHPDIPKRRKPAKTPKVVR